MPPYFLGTKIEAFLGRGQGDMRTSPDFEDIIALLNGRSTLEEEILAAPRELRTYLANNFLFFIVSPVRKQRSPICIVPGTVIEWLNINRLAWGNRYSLLRHRHTGSPCRVMPVRRLSQNVLVGPDLQ